jgi:predicted membrane protein
MKNFLSFLIILVALAAGAGFMVFQREAMIDELTYEKKLQEQRVNFARQAALTIQTPEERYSFDRNQLVADHVAAVERIWRQHPE